MVNKSLKNPNAPVTQRPSNPKVLYEDSQLLVVDKPAGMVVNRAESVKGETLQDWLEKNFQFSIFNFQSLRSGIVHRLDKETSGVLIIAKTPEAFEDLQRQFKERNIEKSYIALVHGKMVPEEGIINAPVGRLPWNRERFGVLPGGREAETKYKTISNFKFLISNEELTLLELYPKTGRTHQLRVHLKSIGHPIVGDQFYAGRKTAREDRKWCPRLFLHAQSITFTHPTSGKRVTITSESPEELQDVLAYLRKRTS
ncbi:MAG: RluA family pseudouridine synthase [Patescibacteria group bacterium]